MSSENLSQRILLMLLSWRVLLSIEFVFAQILGNSSQLNDSSKNNLSIEYTETYS